MAHCAGWAVVPWFECVDFLFTQCHNSNKLLISQKITVKSDSLKKGDRQDIKQILGLRAFM